MFEKFFAKSNDEIEIYCPPETQEKVKQIFDITFPGDYEKITKNTNIKFYEFNKLNKKEILEPEDTIVRELKEEMNFEVKKDELKFIEVVEHDLKYKNGDKAHYKAIVYTTELDEFPTIKLDDESNGIIAISKENYNNFINIKDKSNIQIEKFWEKTIERILKI